MDNLSGSVERITYYNAENGYSVIRLRPERASGRGVSREGLVTVVGNLPELSAGEHLRLQGQWINHPTHGLQFQSEICEQTLPATVSGIRRYLGSGLIKGIGPRLAERIVAHFGADTLTVIEDHPERLREVEDIGPKRGRLIARAWEEQKQVKEIMLFLHSYGVSTNLAIKIYKQYGEQSLQIVQSDPYRMARDIFGVGFKTADRIAQALGLPADHPSRIEAGVVYVLNELSDEGHVFAPRTLLIEKGSSLLGQLPGTLPSGLPGEMPGKMPGEMPGGLILPAVERLEQDGRVRQDMVPLEASATTSEEGETLTARESEAGYYQPAVYLAALYASEVGAAERLAALTQAFPSRLSDLPPAFMSIDPSLSAEQQAAIRAALSHPVSVLTGGPGTGKTTALKALIAALESANKSYALASPTGRAAKRLAEATGRSASTIHRLLGFSPKEGFKFNAEHPLLIDLLVIDEASMLDLVLANHLLKAIQPGCHLLLVGDVDQLPSVGAGDVLRDVIASGVAPVTRLSTIFRQAAGSHIITNAHRINQGQMPLFPHSSEADGQNEDFFLFPAETPEEAANWVVEVVCKRIPKRFGLEPRRQVQVMAPMYRGAAGVTALNEALQANLNPASPRRPEKMLFGQVYRLGDKVMQTHNNYDKEVYNGDIGWISDLDLIEHSLTVEFDGRMVAYDWSEADQLLLAYAVSVHKAQGSEFPAVVIPLLTAHYLMLQRNLLYTAITRARQLCVLVGSKRAIGIAVRNNQVARRYTALDWRLQITD